MIHFNFFFPSLIYFSWSNIKHLDSVFTDWMLHEEFDWSETWNLSYVLFVSDFFPSEPLLLACWILNTWQPMLYSLFFMYCAGTPFGRQSRLTIYNIPHSFFPALSRKCRQISCCTNKNLVYSWRYSLYWVLTYDPHWWSSFRASPLSSSPHWDPWVRIQLVSPTTCVDGNKCTSK